MVKFDSSAISKYGFWLAFLLDNHVFAAQPSETEQPTRKLLGLEVAVSPQTGTHDATVCLGHICSKLFR